jgi:hypothetical protein
VAACRDPHGVEPRFYLQRVPEGKVAKNRIHLDICSSDSTPAGFSQAVSIPVHLRSGHDRDDQSAAIPAGTELSLGIFQLANSLETSARPRQAPNPHPSRITF